MSGSGKAGNGRGNNRSGNNQSGYNHRRPFRRLNKNNNSWQGNNDSERNDNARPSAAGGHFGSEWAAGATTEDHLRTAGHPGKRSSHRGNFSRRNIENTKTEKAPLIERLKWVPPKMNTDPLPVPDCPWCNKPIKDISLAIADRDTGAPVHFECVTARIAAGENLKKGETITYIGGGRFGIVSFGGEGAIQDSPGSLAPDSQTRDLPAEGHDFKIKKIIEWENKDEKAEWRSVICEHYSIT